MNPKLKDYRKAMDETVFKDEQFTAMHRRQVLNRLKTKKRKRQWLPGAMSVAFSLVLLLSVGYLISDYILGVEEIPLQQGSPDPMVGPEPPENIVPPEAEEAGDLSSEEEKEVQEEEEQPESMETATDTGLFELTPEELEAYNRFKVDFDTAHLAGLEPMSVAKLYIYAGYHQEYEVEYELLTDREESIMWDRAEHVRMSEETPETPEQIATMYRNFEEGTFVLTEEDQGYVEFHPKEGPESMMGFGMLKNEDGIWQVSFLPIQ